MADATMAALLAAILTPMAEAWLLSWFDQGVLKCLNGTSMLGRRDNRGKAGTEAHLHMAHGVLKENQVHHCVDFIVVLQGFC